MEVAAIQLPLVDGDLEGNLARIGEALDEAVGADLCLLPELFPCGYDHASWPDAARQADAVTAWMADQARRGSFALAGTLLVTGGDGRLRNRLVLMDRTGEAVAAYDKIHLFRLMDEDRHLAAGTALVSCDLDGVRVGLTTCYDLRFPASYRRMARGGVQLFLVPAQWPLSRLEVMTTLARARAIENQAYLLLTNRCGADRAGTPFGGSSLVCDPYGGTTTAPRDEAAIVRGAVDPAVVAKVRLHVPVFADEVPGLDDGPEGWEVTP